MRINLLNPTESGSWRMNIFSSSSTVFMKMASLDKISKKYYLHNQGTPAQTN